MTAATPTTPVHADPRPAPPRVHLELRDVAKRFGAVRALEGVSLDIHGGQVHGLCGHNGAGKSTLMKVLTGLVNPDAGSVRIDGEDVGIRGTKGAQALGIAIVDQELGIVPALTVAENLFLGNLGESFVRTRRQMHRRARTLLTRVGLDVDPGVRVRDLQAGERKLVEIAHVLGRDARVIVLDEPTASLSHAESRTVFKAVRDLVAQGVGVVFVSHRLDEVFELCDHVTVLRDGRRVESLPIRDLDQERLVELMVGPEGHELPAREQAQRTGPAVSIKGLDAPPIVQGFGLDADGGAIVGLAGQVGSGASEVLRGIAGLSRGVRGTLELDGRPLALGWAPDMVRAGVRYVPGDRKRDGLFLGQSIEGNLTVTRLRAFARVGVMALRARRRAAEALLAIVGVPHHTVGEPVEALSGGNQQKVLLGRTLDLGTGGLLLLDDPTRGVDVHGRAEIHRLVRDAAAAGNTVIFVSTELDEMLDLADVVVTMFEGRIVSSSPVGETSRGRILGEMTHRRTERKAL
jgi:ABC-type sugar transport system ATPase subunit